MPLEFGTDGVRGVAFEELTPEFVSSLGRAAALVLGGPRWCIGRDTRLSSPALAAAFAAGLTDAGCDVLDLGEVPTPLVAFVSSVEAMPAAVISASHNPYTDNGVKLFGAGGRKLADDVEARLSSSLSLVASGPSSVPSGPSGALRLGASAVLDYESHLEEALDGRHLDGVRIVVDCANGAASVVGPRVLRRLGADVTVIHAEPDGTNINADCGSTHPASLQAAVVAAGADAGLALDGDADRLVAVDHTGALVDGDHLLAICARDRHVRGALRGDTVVVTVMTNLGFRLAMAEAGISVIETAVGDRYVLEALEAGGFELGGEQSGHIIFRDVATTGDGILTGIRALDVVARSGRTLHDLAGAAMTQLPQVLRNVRVADRDGLADATGVWEEVALVERELGRRGRVLLRPSGTEPVVRVMVEAPSHAEAEAAVDRLCRVVVSILGSVP